MNARTPMLEKVNAYLLERRRCGFALKSSGSTLANFARFTDRTGYRGPLTMEIARRWAMASEHGRALTTARRIELLRGFARYCQSFDPATEVPPFGLFGPVRRRRTPHIYTSAEIRALLQAARQLPPTGGLRGLTCATVFGLLASCGLRISEALKLTREDVEFEAGRMNLFDSKFGKSRQVPLHPTTLTALRRYAQARDRDPLSSNSNAFFMFDKGRVLKHAHIWRAFDGLRRELGWRSRGDYRYPRIHDLRHTFVCTRLQRWYEQGVDVDRRVHALATYVGHLNPSCTYWYITATPELLAHAAGRLQPLALGGAS